MYVHDVASLYIIISYQLSNPLMFASNFAYTHSYMYIHAYSLPLSIVLYAW